MKKYKDESWLRQKYIDERMTTYEMAEQAGCSNNTIRVYMEEYGIDRRGRSECQIFHRKTPPKMGMKDGYEWFQLHNSGDLIRTYVHQLCAIAWEIASPREVYGGGYDIHHKNEIRWDNREPNLEKMTHSEHRRMHSLKEGLGQKGSGSA